VSLTASDALAGAEDSYVAPDGTMSDSLALAALVMPVRPKVEFERCLAAQVSYIKNTVDLAGHPFLAYEQDSGQFTQCVPAVAGAIPVPAGGENDTIVLDFVEDTVVNNTVTPPQYGG